MLTVYTPGVAEDLLMFDWYRVMGSCEDLEQAFSVHLAPFGAWIEAMRKSFLVYAADDTGVWFASWMDAGAMSGAFYGLWIREDRRHAADALPLVIESIHLGLERFPVLIAVTQQPKVSLTAQRVGFQRLGVVPWIFDGNDAEILWLDSRHFYTAIEPYVTANFAGGDNG